MVRRIRKIENSKLLLIVVSLVEVLVLISVATFGWFFDAQQNGIESDFIQFDASSGLRIDVDENRGSVINVNKYLDDDFVFCEASSVDGSEIFFPSDKYTDSFKMTNQNSDSEPISANTNNLLFRKGNDNDKNKRYVSIDFTVTAESGDDVDVYLGANSGISGKAADAMRAAIITYDEDTEKTASSKKQSYTSFVFGNSMIGYGSSNTSDPINKIDSTGLASTAGSKGTLCFGSYTLAAGKPIFNIKSGTEKRCTLVVWLEGTDPDCTSAVASAEDMDIYLKFTTEEEKLKTVKFYDYTYETWTADNASTEQSSSCYVLLYDNDAGNIPYMMTLSGSRTDHNVVWTVQVPLTVTSMTFKRQSTEEATTKWNTWSPPSSKAYLVEKGSGDDKDYYNYFYALGDSAKGGCGGYWAINDNSTVTKQKIIFLDGSSMRDTAGENSAIGISYTINGQAVSYKLSGDSNCYYANSTSTFKSSAINVTFKKYKNYTGEGMVFADADVDSSFLSGNGLIISKAASDTYFQLVTGGVSGNANSSISGYSGSALMNVKLHTTITGEKFAMWIYRTGFACLYYQPLGGSIDSSKYYTYACVKKSGAGMNACRMYSGSSQNNWENVEYKSGDITFANVASKNCIKLTDLYGNIFFQRPKSWDSSGNHTLSCYYWGGNKYGADNNVDLTWWSEYGTGTDRYHTFYGSVNMNSASFIFEDKDKTSDQVRFDNTVPVHNRCYYYNNNNKGSFDFGSNVLPQSLKMGSIAYQLSNIS